jgi:hypothetical protein
VRVEDLVGGGESTTADTGKVSGGDRAWADERYQWSAAQRRWRGQLARSLIAPENGFACGLALSAGRRSAIINRGTLTKVAEQR